MKVFLLICLTVGYANSAILDSSKSPISKNSQWDDEDSMILAPSTTAATTITSNKNSNDTNTSPTETSTDQEDLITGEQNRPRFLSLIPAGTLKVNGNSIPSKSDQEDQDKMKYQIYSDSTPKVEEEYITSSSDSGDDTGDSTTPPSSSSSEEEDDVSTSEAQEGTTERITPPRRQLKHITLGKIPLTYEIIPLLPPREEKQQLLGREDTTPIGFFPPELQGSTFPQEEITDKTKREQQEQPTTTTSSESEEEGEIITGKPVPELQELPPEPLTYMIPPQREHDGETTVIWNLYPMTTTDSDTDTESNIDLTSPQSTINPLLERINDFLMKAKRHSLETETTTITTDSPTSTEENDQNTEKMETTTSTENDDSSNTIGTTTSTENENHFAISDTPEDSNGDLNPSSPVPIPEEPTEEIYTSTRHQLSPTTTILYPTPNIPEIQDYYTQPSQSLPESPITYFTPPPPPPPQQPTTTQNILQFPPPSSPDQYFSDYHNINTLHQQDHQQPLNPFYYTNPSQSSPNSAAALLRRRLMIASLLNKLASSMPSSSTTTPPPSQPIYIPNDSYWPSKYFNNRAGNNMPTNNIYTPDYNTNYNNRPNYQTNYQTNYNPYINPSSNNGGFSRTYFPQQQQQQQNSYVFPQQQQTTAIPLQAALNVIAASSEEPSYSPYGGSFGGGVDDYSSIPSNPSRGSPYNSNPVYYPSSSSTHYRRSSDNYNNFVNDNYYSSSSYFPRTPTQNRGSAYDVNFSPIIPYRPYQYPVTSSELVNRLMYAPLYPYEEYNRRMNMRTAGFY